MRRITAVLMRVSSRPAARGGVPDSGKLSCRNEDRKPQVPRRPSAGPARCRCRAAALFAERGYAHTPIELLCAEARVTTRHFYEQFESREALLSALYETIIAELRTAVLDALQQPERAPEQRVDSAIRALVQSYCGDPRRARIGVLEVVGVSAAMETRRRAVIHEFARLLEGYADTLAAQGLIPRRDYHLISVALVGGINELLAEWLTSARRPGLQQLVEVIAEMLRALILGGRALLAGSPA
jgi:AcrR family transcriptional regulator